MFVYLENLKYESCIKIIKTLFYNFPGAWQKTIESHRDLVIEDEKLITDESKRSFDSYSMCGQMFGVNGTFTKLNID